MSPTAGHLVSQWEVKKGDRQGLVHEAKGCLPFHTCICYFPHSKKQLPVNTFVMLMSLKNYFSCFWAACGAWGRERPVATNMKTLYRVPFLVLQCPHRKLKKRPRAHHHDRLCSGGALVVVSHFLLRRCLPGTVRPPSIGSRPDEHGPQRPVAFLAYRVDGPCIIQELVSSFLFTVGGLAFIILHQTVQTSVDFFYLLRLCPIEFFHGQNVDENGTAGLSKRLECLLRRNQWMMDLLLLMKFWMLCQSSNMKGGKGWRAAEKEACMKR